MSLLLFVTSLPLTFSTLHQIHLNSYNFFENFPYKVKK